MQASNLLPSSNADQEETPKEKERKNEKNSPARKIGNLHLESKPAFDKMYSEEGSQSKTSAKENTFLKTK